MFNQSHIQGQKPIVNVEIWGSGKPMREFLYSEDMADACVFLMENVDFTDLVEIGYIDQKLENIESKSIENCLTIEEIKSRNVEIRNTHINIGTGEEISIKALAELVKKIIGFSGELKFNISKPDGTMRKLTDPSKLNKLGWKHSVGVEEGIGLIYNWYCKD